MGYKHKFLLSNNNATTEIATCADQMTADYLASFYRGVYGKNKDGLEVTHKLGKKETIVANATIGN